MANITREQLVIAARSLVGTPFHHAGRKAGLSGGVDCVGVIVLTWTRVGYPFVDVSSYSQIPDDSIVLDNLRPHADEIDKSELEYGDVGVFWLDRNTRAAQHMGIFTRVDTRLYLVHSHQRIGKVIEAGVSSISLKRLVAVFRCRGLESN